MLCHISKHIKICVFIREQLYYNPKVVTSIHFMKIKTIYFCKTTWSYAVLYSANWAAGELDVNNCLRV